VAAAVGHLPPPSDNGGGLDPGPIGGGSTLSSRGDVGPPVTTFRQP
jgi:hypothetical protein